MIWLFRSQSSKSEIRNAKSETISKSKKFNIKGANSRFWI